MVISSQNYRISPYIPINAWFWPTLYVRNSGVYTVILAAGSFLCIRSYIIGYTVPANPIYDSILSTKCTSVWLWCNAHSRPYLIYKDYVVCVNRQGQADDHGDAAFIDQDGVSLVDDGIVQLLRKDLRCFMRWSSTSDGVCSVRLVLMAFP
jgi:hypothetical protein